MLTHFCSFVPLESNHSEEAGGVRRKLLLPGQQTVHTSAQEDRRLSVHPSPSCPPFHPSAICSSIHLPFQPPVHPSIHPSVHLSFHHAPVRLSFYPSFPFLEGWILASWSLCAVADVITSCCDETDGNKTFFRLNQVMIQVMGVLLVDT